ncbi:hypothetical protein CHLNCDRAFT_49501 [Chlorella variabilis]|uniref:Uncharacterized protein n=1 Tax=Chlorella variabilis TaxID=554065 RepID=E1Z2P5_CHLVA|nr:hypothetical protein CHLNCDRAFT_49501 [Chlorella variabilis]EFN60034.1 hypothetical protein CHLNCDRAFT_49501 [Chlorella variabilis]|eukprot:XP_005852136.1 hypothetical protein CHLNCDRAFT_49501 [Chlorella variabilis]
MYHSLQVLWVEAGMGRGWLQHCGTRAGTGLVGRYRGTYSIRAASWLQTGWVSHETGIWTFVATGDLPLMWIRDSAVQISVLIPRMARQPQLRAVVEGAIRAQAFYIMQDPYANGYEPEWRHPESRHKGDRTAGRGGWVGVRNYELDSGAYYLNLLWNYFLTPGLYRPDALISEPSTYDAANLLVDVWVREQRHNASSPYRFHELSNGGLGPLVDFTGAPRGWGAAPEAGAGSARGRAASAGSMTWSGFRPSDDASQYGFPIPANMYAYAGLARALELNKQVWQMPEFEAKVTRLMAEIKSGIEKHGVVEVGGGERVYAYEVDGKGASLTDFDDPNVPSLISVPMLGFPYDKEVYAATRRRLLDSKTNSPQDQAQGLRTLLKLQCGDGLMHESVHVDNTRQCTRKWFEWANALLVVSVERLLGYDCDDAAQAYHRGYSQDREKKDGGSSDANIYAPFHAHLQYDGVYQSKVADWAGMGHVIPIEGT